MLPPVRLAAPRGLTVLALVGLMFLAGCGSKLSKANYDKIKGQIVAKQQ